MNHVLLRTIGELLPDDAQLELYDGLEQLPIFNSDLPEPPGVLALKGKIASADGVLFAVPEYNYSVPGGLKNALDWVSRPPATLPRIGEVAGGRDTQSSAFFSPPGTL